MDVQFDPVQAVLRGRLQVSWLGGGSRLADRGHVHSLYTSWNGTRSSYSQGSLTDTSTY